MSAPPRPETLVRSEGHQQAGGRFGGWENGGLSVETVSQHGQGWIGEVIRCLASPFQSKPAEFAAGLTVYFRGSKPSFL